MTSGAPTLLISDIDGTLLDAPHYKVWQQVLAVLLADNGRADSSRDTPHGVASATLSLEYYRRHVQGRDRSEGARAVLAAAGLSRRPSAIACALLLKQEIYTRVMHEAVLFEDATRLLQRLHTRNQDVAFCTSSANAGALLRGRLADCPRLRGHLPALDRSMKGGSSGSSLRRTDLLLRVAAAWGVEPGRCVVVDDTVRGIRAATALGMTGVLIDRTESSREETRGVWVVRTLDELRLTAETEPALTIISPHKEL